MTLTTLSSRFFLTFAIMLMGYSSLFAQLPKGDRILAWQVDMAENGDYLSAYEVATTACMESIHVFFPWTSLESAENTFLQEGITNLDIINIYHPLNNIKVELQLAPVNTVAKEVPSDLFNEPFDSPILIDRFKALLDTVFLHIPDVELTSLNIGNESDVFFGTDQAQYDAFKLFLDEVIPYAKELYFNLHQEDLKVGTVFTHTGLVSPSTTNLCESVNDELDIVATTYYPLNGNFTMKSPEVVADDFEELVALYSDVNQPIYFTECGYSSSTFCNSSQELQSEFYANVFQAWDDHYDHIKYLTIFKTTDWSSDEVDAFIEYYGIDTIEFIEYLRALGLRTWAGDGTDKLAYDQVKCELDARDWCDVACSVQSITSENIAPVIACFPNPSNGNFTLKSSTNSRSDYKLVDQQGRLLFSGYFTGQKTLDFNTLTTGVYYLAVVSEEFQTTKKLVIQ